jgi:hypothetical protein
MKVKLIIEIRLSITSLQTAAGKDLENSLRRSRRKDLAETYRPS